MENFNLGNLNNRFINNQPQSPNSGPQGGQPTGVPLNPDMKFPTPQTLAQSATNKSLLNSAVINSFRSEMLMNLKMNNIESSQRGLYLKDLMKLPKDMEQMLVMLQNNSATTKEMTKLLTTNINLSTLAELMQKNGKEAMNKLVLTMAEASKQGLSDVSQLKDAIKFINASVSVAAQDNPNQVLKNFMLLYLPWLPLQEGVDFDLEIESSEGEDGEDETTISIMITTRNYGNVKITLILSTGNSLSIIVNCSQEFPKEKLLTRINDESKKHSMQSQVMFEQKAMKKDENATHQAKINMSNLKQVNPFLLLMANAVIRHTIELDNLAG